LSIDAKERTADVAIVGAGPVGLTLANFLGCYGISTLVIERGEALIDYPRGVGMDDECLRSFQAIGLVEEVRKHTTPDQWLKFLTASGRCFASVEPRTREFGWPRRNAFIQPLVDRVLLEALGRFSNADVLFGHTLTDFSEDSDGVALTVSDGRGEARKIRARFLVGCDGGRSIVRKIMNVGFEGETESTRWVVIDVRNDPIGVPDAYLYCIPSRPFVSIALPHGIRRLEFMVLGDETEEQLCAPGGLHRLLRQVIPKPEQADIIRARVYTHHARLASSFRIGRALLAGDAAHLMPVWQGQGYNSGIRDANNLAWKLAMVARGAADAALLDSYDAERRTHAAAMISISVTAGRIFSPTRRWVAALRDGLTWVLNAIPAVKNYVLQMRFKPMPRYVRGAVIHDAPGRIPATSPVGRLFIQPSVTTVSGETLKLDDAVGAWFSIVAWGSDPRRHMASETLSFWKAIGARFVLVMPTVQLNGPDVVQHDDGLLVLGDAGGDLKGWFGSNRASFVVLRPDRFVAASAGSLQMIDDVTRRMKLALHAAGLRPCRSGSRCEPR